MTAATQSTVVTQDLAVAIPEETSNSWSSNIWWRRLGLLLIVGSGLLTYGGLYLAFR